MSVSRCDDGAEERHTLSVTYITGQDITAQWDTTSDARSLSPPTQTLSPSAARTILVTTTTGGVELAQVEIDGATGPATITNATLIAALGAEITFKLRAYAERDGYRSLDFDTIAVCKT